MILNPATAEHFPMSDSEPNHVPWEALSEDEKAEIREQQEKELCPQS